MTNVVVDPALLRNELGFVAKLAISKRSGTDLFRFVLCEVEGQVMRLTTAAPDAVAWSAVPLIGPGHPPLAFAVNARLLHRVLGKLDSRAEITLSIEEAVVNMYQQTHHVGFDNSHEAQAKLRERVLLHQSAACACSIPASQLTRAVVSALPFIYWHNTQPVNLNAVFFIPKKDRIEVVACNRTELLAAKLAPVLGPIFAKPVAISPKYARILVELTRVPTDMAAITEPVDLVRFDCAPRGLAITGTFDNIPTFDELFDITGSTVKLQVDAKRMRHEIGLMSIGASKFNSKLNFLTIDHTRLVLYRIKPFEGCESGCTELAIQANGVAAFALESKPLGKFLRTISGTVTIHVAPEVSEGPRIITWVAENGMEYAAAAMPVDPPGNPAPWEEDDEA